MKTDAMAGIGGGERERDLEAKFSTDDNIAYMLRAVPWSVRAKHVYLASIEDERDCWQQRY